jgi:hypothetical protein
MRVVFATYHSSPRIAEAQQSRTPAFDLVIADEAHRCAGPQAGDFATVLAPKRIKASKRLFMTATPRYFTGRVQKEARDADWEVASMDDETQFGPVLHRLSFAKAIEQGLLSDYQVAVVGVTDATYRDYAERGVFVTGDGEKVTDARTLASQLGLLRAMANYDLRRLVTFHSRIRSASAFARSLPEVCAWLPADRRPGGNLWAEHVSGEMTSGERDIRLNKLRVVDSGVRGILTNARCLAEGVDVPTLDGVAFIEPRRSQVDVVQAVGRAIRKAPDKTIGTVVIPVFVDADGDADQALESGEFQKVWDVLKALRAHDDALADELDELRRELGRRGTIGERPAKIVLDVPVTVGEQFARAFDTRLVERSTARWDEAIGAAQAYRSEHGNLLVPVSYTTANGFRLGAWIDGRRQYRRRGWLTDARIAELDSLEMVWDPYEDAWGYGLAKATAFQKENGHLHVLLRYRTDDGFRLGGWINEARTGHKRGTLSRERVAGLDRLGMEWDVHDAAWERGIAAARAYQVAHGDLLPSAKQVTGDGFRLGLWIADKRHRRRKGELSRERIAQLDALGLVWEPNHESWQRNIAAAQQYLEENGHLRVPQKFVTSDGFALGTWMTNLRTPRIRRTLSARRVRELDALGMVWDPRTAAYAKALQASRAYRAHHGHLDVPASWVSEDGYKLGGWIARRRADHRIGKLDAALKVELDALGIVWEREEPWERALAAARAYQEANGHLRVPQTFVADDGTRLGQWLTNWRSGNRRGKLDAAIKAELDQLGMVWEPSDYRWERGVAGARSYQETHGHLRVPTAYTTEDGFPLGSWLNTRRIEAKRGDLSRERFTELDALGLTWSPMASKWERDLGAARAYRDAHENLRVPTKFVAEDGFRLGAWVARLRQDRKHGRLSRERIADLDALGMAWEPNDEDWERGLAAARAFQSGEGHLRVPQRLTTDDDFRLGAWINRRRSERRQGTLSSERIAELDALGMVWQVRRAKSAKASAA